MLQFKKTLVHSFVKEVSPNNKSKDILFFKCRSRICFVSRRLFCSDTEKHWLLLLCGGQSKSLCNSLYHYYLLLFISIILLFSYLERCQEIIINLGVDLDWMKNSMDALSSLFIENILDTRQHNLLWVKIRTSSRAHIQKLLWWLSSGSYSHLSAPSPETKVNKKYIFEHLVILLRFRVHVCECACVCECVCVCVSVPQRGAQLLNKILLPKWTCTVFSHDHKQDRSISCV